MVPSCKMERSSGLWLVEPKGAAARLNQDASMQAGERDMSYIRFGLMILTSTMVMFVLMYLNTYAWEHLFFSETRTYMAIMMGAAMAVIMLAYMLGMYSNTGLNIAIFAGAVILFALTLWLVRSQITVSGQSYM